MRPVKLAPIVSLAIIVCIHAIGQQTGDLPMVVVAQSTAAAAAAATALDAASTRQVEQQIVAPQARNTSGGVSDYKTPLNHGDSHQGATRPRQPEEDSLETSPSVTSVHHQVWTSSSSGSLDELSPEIISKLRNDVPFLAAYATRPRLVGVNLGLGGPTSVSTSGAQPLGAAGHPDTLSPSSSSSSSLDAGAGSSPRAARQLLPSPASGSLASSRLADFSELAVETSSLSKSEHHHRRRTSLKKKPAGRAPATAHSMPADSLGRRRVLAEASRLVVKRNKLLRKTPGARQAKRAGASRRPGKGPSARLTSKRHKARGQRRKELRSRQRLLARSGGKRARYQEEADLSGTKGGGGGKAANANKRPFYASKLDPKKSDDELDEVGDSKQASSGSVGTSGNEAGASPPPVKSDGAGGSASNGVDGNQIGGGSNESDADEDYGSAIDDDGTHVEPKRVGDPDVDEEEGDTVLVEPKSDGVDDDPELPQEEAEGGSAENGGGGGGAGGSTSPLDDGESPEREGKRPSGGGPTTDEGANEIGGADKTSSSSGGTPLAEGDQRGKRVNRERQNPPRDREEAEAADDSDDSPAGDGVGGSSPSLASGGGGGIGGTTGSANGGSTPKSSGGGTDGDRGDDNDGDDDTDADADADNGRGPASGRDGADRDRDDDADHDDRRRRRPASESGVEFARDDEARVDSGAGSAKKGSKEGDEGDGRSPARGSQGSASDGGGDQTDDFGRRNERRPTPTGSSGGSADGRGSDKPDEVDDDDDLDYRDEMVGDQEKRNRSHGVADGSKTATATTTPPGADKPDSTAPSSSASEGKDCDDGSYKHHDEKYHDEHHQTSDWLRGSIPGEPDDDYPTLSRVNATNFKCDEQKYPGYYADVETRCQVFHICQADGRQDSFLCSNGTIFSQRTLVCVWWNGFDCEDAPKYYHLNALLYKRRQGIELDGSAADHGKSDDAADGSGHLRPLGGRKGGDGPLMPHLRPRDMPASGGRRQDSGDRDEDSSSIESLIKTMKQQGGGGAGGKQQPNKPMLEITPDDEATIQRKSTNAAVPDDDDDDDVATSDGSASRLRARGVGGGIPRRRKRLAGTRQAPPKLKSRRVSRNSRRRKLRHGIKPKRRA